MTSIAAPPQLPFSLGTPSTFRGLTVIPLFPDSESTLEYVGLDEAVAYGLEITEVDLAGSVNDLLVWNPLDLGTLIFEGEELVGAKQNRILDRTVFVNAKSRTKLNVNCVERGRWSYRSERFSPAPRAAHPGARYSARVGGQSAVWSEIAAKSTRLDALSETEAAEAMYVKNAGTLSDYVTALPRRPGQSGAIVCLAGRVTCLDYVSRSEVFAGLYAKLLRGYALDAIERPVDAPVPTEYVRVLLDRLARSGHDAGEIRGRGFVGSRLTIHDEVVALSVFPTGRA